MRQQRKSDLLNSVFISDTFSLLHESEEQNPNFNVITAKAATIKTTPKGRHYIKAGERVYLETLNNHSSLTDGKTYIFNRERTKVKRLLNWI